MIIHQHPDLGMLVLAQLFANRGEEVEVNLEILIVKSQQIKLGDFFFKKRPSKRLLSREMYSERFGFHESMYE